MRLDHESHLHRQTIQTIVLNRILHDPPVVVLRFHAQVARRRKSCIDVHQKIPADQVMHNLLKKKKEKCLKIELKEDKNKTNGRNPL